MSDSPYIFGKVPALWKDGEAQSITFVVTEDCNLRCKYCYITHKNSKKKLNLNTAKQFIDMIFSEDILRQPAVILEFIGGEPLLEANLIDEIVDYFVLKAYEIGSDWYWNYMISICSNGVNYNDSSVQRLIQKHRYDLSLSITLDGTKIKHDLNRVFLDGSGSYNAIMKNVPLWLNDFLGATKVTFASKDLIYLKDSIISLWNHGIKEVSANVVFEDVWQEGDDLVFENQLKSLADYVLENKLYDKYYCTLFDDSIGGYYDEEDLYQTFCGAGKMIAVGPNGVIYPCIRFKDYSLNNHEERAVGNLTSGLDMERVRPFMLAAIKYQSDSECLNCEIAHGCGFCQGFNYDDSKTSTNFYRAKYICKMHKARVRANDYYFSKLFNIYSIEKEKVFLDKEEKITYILESNDYVSFCQHTHGEIQNESFNNLIPEALEYARQLFSIPVIVHSNNVFNAFTEERLIDYRIRHIIPFKFYENAVKANLKDCTYVFDTDDLNKSFRNISIKSCILNINVNEISILSEMIIKLFQITDKIKLNIINIDERFDKTLYEQQLLLLKNYLVRNRNKHINILSDLATLESHRGCKAGDRSFTISPEGYIYICPAFYDLDIGNSIGNINNLNLNFCDRHLFRLDYKPLCQNCDIYTCDKCCYLNKKSTGEVNVPPSYQCIKSHIEKRVALKLYKESQINHLIKPSEYDDPMNEWLIKHDLDKDGYYKVEDKK